MLTTITECHVVFDTLVQESNSEVKRTIRPEIKDYFLNLALMSWLKTRTNDKTNPKKEGVSESVKRVNDLKDLEKTYKFNTIYQNDELSVFGILPYDYDLYITSYCNASNNCTKPAYPVISNTITYYTLKLEPNKPINKDFILTINNSIVLSSTDFNNNNPVSVRPDSIFIGINYILNKINNNTGFNIYWERYNDIYVPGSFILINGASTISSCSMQYYNGSSTYSVSGVSNDLVLSKIDIIQNGSATKECILIGSNTGVRGILNNRVKSRNLHEHPLTILEGNKIIVYHNNSISVKNINLVYYKKPTLYNVLTKAIPEIKNHEEVVHIAVKYYLGSLADQAYTIQKDIEQTIE